LVSTPTPLADTTLRKAIILLSLLAVGALLYFAQDVFIPGRYQCGLDARHGLAGARTSDHAQDRSAPEAAA
jgi:hypothetical protein